MTDLRIRDEFGATHTLTGAFTYDPVSLPPPLPVGDHDAYFRWAIARPEHHWSWSGKSQDMINAITKTPPNTYVTYDPANDPHPERQDAAKWRIDTQQVTTDLWAPRFPSGAMLQFPLNRPTFITSGSILVTWKSYMTREWRTPGAGAWNPLKHMGLVIDGHSAQTIMHNLGVNLSAMPGHFARVDHEATKGSAAFQAATKLNYREPYDPGGPRTWTTMPRSAQFPIPYSQWVQHYLEIQLHRPAAAFGEWAAYRGLPVLPPNPDRPDGLYYMLSHWIGDRNGLQRVYYRTPRTGLATWDMNKFQMIRLSNDTSEKFNTPTPPVPLYAYIKDVIVWKDYPLGSDGVDGGQPDEFFTLP